MNLINRAILQVMLIVITASTAPAFASAKPNIVFILIDDLGWSDVGCYGSDYYETPHIDRLAAQGMRFTNAYAASCVCSPTRVSIMTGKYPGRLHITHAIPIDGSLRLNAKQKGATPLLDADYCKNLPLEEVTMAEALKEHGYATGFLGKWHCCWDKAYYPEHQGFDINLGGNNMGNPGDYFHPYYGQWRMTKDHPWTKWNALPDGKPGEYLTDRLTDEAVQFIERHRERPFYLNLSHYAVHTPIQAKQDKVDKYQAKPKDTAKGHSHAAYAAMIESVDDSVGRVLKTLDDLGLANNTIIIFTSDNGGFWRVTSNYPLRGNKGNFYEGGIRVPVIVKWPGVVAPGSSSDEVITSTDFYPTLLEMAGLPQKPEQHVDGLSFVPVLKQEGALNRDAIYWHFPNYIGAGHRDGATPCSVIRQGDWKLIESLEDGSVQLFDLKHDTGETNNLAEEHPQKLAALRTMLAYHRRETKAQMPRRNPYYLVEMGSDTMTRR